MSSYFNYNLIKCSLRLNYSFNVKFRNHIIVLHLPHFGELFSNVVKVSLPLNETKKLKNNANLFFALGIWCDLTL